MSRARLLRTLNASPPRALTLIRAPAGWGKTMLLLDWMSSPPAGWRFAWLALDEADNDQARFWSYVIEALRTVVPGIGAYQLALVKAPGVDVARDMLPLLINELADSGVDIVLALDDYHLIQNDAIHRAMAVMVERLPANVRLAIASREEPPLPLPRLRARQALAHVDADQLRFSDEEAQRLLNEVHALGLQARDVGLLREHTEGWPAGLYLAVLSLGGRDDVPDFIGSFAADDRHVVEYFTAEVLAGQPDEIRRFLLRTSVLDRFCVPLSQAVSGMDDARELLQRIERSNYFLVSLDTRCGWYRYHHLFRDLLRKEFLAVAPLEVPELHRRAAEWLKQEGVVPEAIVHSTAAGDYTEASELIAAHWLQFANSGGRGTVLGWLDALPDEVVRADARLCIAKALTLAADGRVDEVLPWADAAERAEVASPFRDLLTSRSSGVAIARAAHWLGAGDVAQTERFAREALDLEQAPVWRSVAMVCLGASAYFADRPDEAAGLFAEAVPLGRVTVPVATIFALGYLALIAADGAEWDEAAERSQAAADLAEECQAGEYFVTSTGRIAHGRLLTRYGALAEAESELERAVALARRGAGPLLLISVLVALAEARGAAGDRAAAHASLTEAREIFRTLPQPGSVVPRLLERSERELHPGAGRSAAEGLSERELEVLRLLPSAMSQREIGGELSVSYNTAKAHTRSIFRKLDVSSRDQAVDRARKLGIL